MDEEFLVKHPKTIHGLLKAHVRATRFIKEHPEEAAEIGTKYTGMDLKTVKLAMKRIIYAYVPNVEGELYYVKFLKQVGAIKVEDPGQFVKELIDIGPLNRVLKKN
ncbi:MAG: ABC transporter substrate-binding protein [Desulfobacteraceae bacterium]|nr:ABC transporter substrate-binding protein [Desulfobacteraceae bacterium]